MFRGATTHGSRWLIIAICALLCVEIMAGGGIRRAEAQVPQARLGELRVDWYCLQRGLSAWIINNGATWVCTAANGAVVLSLNSTDLNAVCQGYYNNARAFAMQDRSSGIAALDWSCYVEVAPTAIPTVAPVVVPVRLGEFQVEWYCNERGLGVRVINNDTDWACTNSGSDQVNFVLGQNDFNSICQRTYGNLRAYARRDQGKPQPAYNWSCYVDTYVIPTATPVPTRTPQIVRLGEFQVEWYCNERGYGVRVINNQADWACTNSANAVVFVLSQQDFNAICQRTYNDPNAFASRDQTRPEPAYNWSCYTRR